MKHPNVYEIGQQPCNNFAPDDREEWWGPSVHECPICYGERMVCKNCGYDHHLGGWEVCSEETGRKREIREEDRRLKEMED